MMPGDATTDAIFYEDRRAVWRVTWTLGLGFLLVTGLMRDQGAWLWPIFAGFALLMLWIGVSAALGRAKPLLGVSATGLCVYAGDVGIGGTGDAAEHVIPWDVITSFAFEERSVSRVREGRRTTVTVLSFGIDPSLARPDGHRGFLVELVERRGRWALGEHLIWEPEKHRLDLLTRPRGGHARLTAAIARRVPRQGDPSLERRQGLGGPVTYALYDLALALLVLGATAIVATGEIAISQIAEPVLVWGTGVSLR